MQTFKIILGVIIGFATLKTMIEMIGEESGAGLAGAFTGFLILGGLAGWLIYSGITGGEKKNEKKN